MFGYNSSTLCLALILIVFSFTTLTTAQTEDQLNRLRECSKGYFTPDEWLVPTAACEVAICLPFPEEICIDQADFGKVCDDFPTDVCDPIKVMGSSTTTKPTPPPTAPPTEKTIPPTPPPTIPTTEKTLPPTPPPTIPTTEKTIPPTPPPTQPTTEKTIPPTQKTPPATEATTKAPTQATALPTVTKGELASVPTEPTTTETVNKKPYKPFNIVFSIRVIPKRRSLRRLRRKA